MRLKNILFFMLLLFVSCERYEERYAALLHTDSWEVDFGLATGNCVVYNDTLYILFGREEGESAEEPSMVWRCAPMSDLSDFEVMDLPIGARVNGVAIVVGDKMYAGLGFRGKVYNRGAYLRDWWEYDFVCRRWTRLTDFPTEDVVAPIVWSDKRYIYTLYGSSEGVSGVVYQYDIEADRWKIYGDKSAPWKRYKTLGGVVDDRLYCGGVSTFDSNQYWWCYDWQKDEWKECTKVPRMARFFASSVAIEDCVYVLGGRFLGGTETREYFYETIIFYNTANDEWHTLGRMEQAAENMIAFEYDGDLYWGLGQMVNGEFVKKIYKWEN